MLHRCLTTRDLGETPSVIIHPLDVKTSSTGLRGMDGFLTLQCKTELLINVASQTEYMAWYSKQSTPSKIQYTWRQQITIVAKAGYGAVAPDYTGFRLIDIPVEHDQIFFVDLVKDTGSILDHLNISKQLYGRNSVEEDDNIEGSFVGIENAFEESYIEVDDTGWGVNGDIFSEIAIFGSVEGLYGFVVKMLKTKSAYVAWRRQLAIKGVFINGDWVEDPTRVKREFYDHFIREANERYGSSFNPWHADAFNSFIDTPLLNDISLGGYRFTWSDNKGSKMSKLDKFLVSEDFLDSFHSITGVVLEKGLPDHRPILLKLFEVDYRPTPFRFFHSWLEMDGFKDLVADSWKNDGVMEANESAKIKKEHQDTLLTIDHLIDHGIVSEDNLSRRRDAIRVLNDVDKLDSIDIAQKARVRWALEGDENTSFFHGVVKKGGDNLLLKVFSLMAIGWKILIVSNESSMIILREFLKHPFTSDEIKWAVWDCGGDCKFPIGCNPSFIALIPKVANARFVFDFRPISLIGSQYKIVGKILANRLSMVISSCISSEQSAFVKGRNIVDGPIIINEVIAWYRKHKKNLMVFKVDIEKAFDSLRWDYLDLIMSKFGFGSLWRSWILGCLRNATSSILINGSPTQEFDIQRGLRQGDSLSTFLFILAMEGLHVLSRKEESLGLFKGVLIGYEGLKINVNKCSLLGIGIADIEVSNLANHIGCAASSTPFKYLGVPVGGNMNRYSSWDVVINKFRYTLSQWKARLLSVGGRLTIIKSILSSLPVYYLSIYKMPVAVQHKLESLRSKFFIGGDLDARMMSWVRWNKCLASKEKGGLGIGSLYGLNIGLLFKWIWHFLYSPSDLWVKVIKFFHGDRGRITDRSSSI
nr:RNA-directed DNA polymerase, eukaryota [Tanacetum cinerariifolium]